MSIDPPPTVAILGLGYVGLPLAQAASYYFPVLGFDVDESVSSGLNSGTSHIQDIEDVSVSAMMEKGFRATHSPGDLAAASIYVICVPTPLSETGGPDLSAVKKAGEVVASNLSQGDLVILESTTYPGTTDSFLLPILEQSGLKAGEGFLLAFSPERIDPGNPAFTIANTPKVVGGLTPACRDAAAAFYKPFVCEVVLTQGLREAEMAKLLENTYRHVNIALVNEMLRFSNDLDINLWDVISAASSKPFGFQAFYPGPGVGGHCIPIDPNYLSHFVRAQTGYAFRLVELAQEINAQMPAYVVSRVQDMLNADGISLRGASVLLLGVSYKADIADSRESPAYAVARNLAAKGANLTYHDPFFDSFVVDGSPVKRTEDLEVAIGDFDCVVLLQVHSAFDPDLLAGKANRFLDTRGNVSDHRYHL